MKCKVFDDIFDELYLHEIYNKILSFPLNLTNVANRKTFPYGNVGSHRLIGATVFHRSNMNRIDEYIPDSDWCFDIFEQIETRIENDLYLESISLNVQNMGCDGTTHVDAEESNEYTLLVMTNPTWKKEWGGEFQLMKEYVNDDNMVLETYKYVPGRVIILPGAHPHRGLSPKEKYVYRTSIVYRVHIHDDEDLTYIDS